MFCIQKARRSSPLSSTGQRPNAILKASKQSQTRRPMWRMTATARRGHGEGSVYRDAANGTWVGAISLGWRPDGSRIRRKVTGRTKTEVREKLKKLQAEADAGLKTSASYTVAKAVADWAAHCSALLTTCCTWWPAAPRRPRAYPRWSPRARSQGGGSWSSARRPAPGSSMRRSWNS